jgi:hypothetical protein
MLTMLRECRALADAGMAVLNAAAPPPGAIVKGDRVHIVTEDLIVF